MKPDVSTYWHGLDYAQRASLLARLGSKIAFNRHGCWEWTGTRSGGYGSIHIPRVGMRYAHRLMFEAVGREIPDGYVLDHLCRNRGCVNPEHLEAVTYRENTLRGDTLAAKAAAQTHCIHGHEFTEENTWSYPSKRTSGRVRVCKTCHYRRMGYVRKVAS